MAAGSAEDEVVKVEEAYRAAKIKGDVSATRQILADGFYGTNQYGASRDRAQLRDMYRSGFRLAALAQPRPDVRITGTSPS